MVNDCNPNYTQMSERDLLIRIDERQQHMHIDLNTYMIKTEVLKDNFNILDKDKISKKSIAWFVTITGGCMGIISTIFIIVSRVVPF